MRLKTFIKLSFVLIIFGSFKINVGATTLRQLYNELSSLQSSYAAAQKKASMTQDELNRVKASISSTEAEIKKAQNEIIAAENEIIKSEAEIAKKKEETNQMMLYLQLMNSTGDSMLEYVMDSSDYTDFIYRYSIVTQMSDYNNGLMDELNKLIESLNAKKATLNKKQQELAVKKTELESKYVLVQVQYKNDLDSGLSVSSQISEKKKLIKVYEGMGCSMDQDVGTCNSMAPVSGWTYPLKSFYQSSAYAEGRGSVRHYAVDLAVSEGNKVYAIANGEVISAAVGNNGCGGMIIQIKHKYNGSYYVSLYMHLIDSYVSVGTKVTGGQAIGTSGGGSREKAKWGDRCTEGAHLHFAMATGERMIGYSSQAGSTFNPQRFFPAMKGIGARYNY